MRFDVFTIFPGIFQGPLTESILKRAQEESLVSVHLHDIRAWSTDKHHSVDDYPYGGGAGMVMMAPPIVQAVDDVVGADRDETQLVILTPSGERFRQEVAVEFASLQRLVLICGRYEGIDERVPRLLNARELSIGDFVMTGGELAAAVIIDVVSRLVPGVIDAESITEESHTGGLLEYPHYTRPAEYRGLTIPEVLLSGHHAKIAQWRREQSLRRTLERRPELLESIELNKTDRRFLDQLLSEQSDKSSPHTDE